MQQLTKTIYNSAMSLDDIYFSGFLSLDGLIPHIHKGEKVFKITLTIEEIEHPVLGPE